LVVLFTCSVYSEQLLDELPTTSTGGQSNTGGATTTNDGGMGGAVSSSNSGGGNPGGAGGKSQDLGWPFDDSVPSACPANPPDSSGNSWSGWGNYQHPAQSETTVGQSSEPLFGRTYAAGQTPGAGQAAGWQAELAVGPYGSVPTGDGRCWSYEPASFNLDVGNDDEYTAAITPPGAGLYGLFFRYRPPGGAWRYGDRDGSDNGIVADQAGLLIARAKDLSAKPLVVASQNLRCRIDWEARKPLVIKALARIDPDIVVFQEDCLASGISQAAEIAAALASYTSRGYERRRASTHLAMGTVDEGISVLSAHHIESSHTLDLPHVHFPRKALAVDLKPRGSALRVYVSHFDYGAEAAAAREQSADAIVADLPVASHSIVAGDLNTTPDSNAIAKLTAALDDLWAKSNPNQDGVTFPASNPDGRIDYVLGSSQLAGALLGAKLLDEQDGNVLLSDHLGVAVAFAFP